MTTLESTTPRRVKLYKLLSDKWLDCGTGYCSGLSTPKPHFHVLDESNDSDILLDSPISGSTQYQRQQDTLIVWTNKEGIDYALSFQEPEGCIALCEFLVKVQQSLEPGISLVAVIQSAEGEVTEVIAGPIPELPFPTEDNLNEVLDVLGLTQYRANMLEEVVSNNCEWLKRLIGVFKKYEEKHNLTGLYCLSDIVKTLVYYNDVEVFEGLIGVQVVEGIVGILEYEPEFPGLKMDWRGLLNDTVKLKEVIGLKDDNIREQVRRCCILQFLKDVVLARLLDDSSFNCLSSMIQMKESKVLEFIRGDVDFLKELFQLFDLDNNDDSLIKKRDGIKLIHQFVIIAKKSQSGLRYEFYRALIDKGLFKMIQFASKDIAVDSRVLATEVMVTIIEQDVLLFKTPAAGEDNINKDFDDTLVSTLTDVLINEKNIGLKTQAFEALKVFLDPNNLIETNSNCSSPLLNLNDDNNNLSSTDDDGFIIGFYRESAKTLFGSLANVEVHGKMDKVNVVCYSDLCELVSFVAKYHEKIYSRSFILEHHLLQGIAKLMNENCGYQLRLSALRCIKSIIVLDDEFYTRYIIQYDILRQFTELLREVNDENNLANSACLNLLHLLLQNEKSFNFKLLRNYLAEKYENVLENNFLGKRLLKLELDEDNIDKENENDKENEDNEVKEDDSSSQSSNVKRCYEVEVENTSVLEKKKKIDATV